VNRFFHLTLIIAATAFLYPWGNAFAQLPGLVIKVREITVEDGLASRFIAQIYQDSEDYLWVVTSEGLNRYDGYRMEMFNPAKMGSRMEFPYSVMEDCEHRIWITSQTGRDADIFNLISRTVAPAPQEFPFSADSLSSVGHIPGQLILFGARHGQIYGYDGSYFLLYHDPSGRPIQGLRGEADGSVFFLTGNELNKIDRSGAVKGRVSLPPGPLEFKTNRLGDIWGLSHSKTEGIRVFHFLPEKGRHAEWPVPAEIHAIPLDSFSWAPDQEGNLLFSGPDFLGLYDGNGKRRIDFSEEVKRQLGPFYFQNILISRTGSYFMRNRSGLVRISWSPNPFRHYLDRPPVSIRGMAFVNDSMLLAANYRQLLLLNVGSGEVEFLGSGDMVGLGLCKDSLGYWWMGRHTPEFARISPDFRTVEEFEILNPPSRMPRPEVFGVIPFTDHQGRVWFGLSRGLAFFHPESGEITALQPEAPWKGLMSKSVNCFYEDDEGIWVGTSGGLYLLDLSGKVISFADTLRSIQIQDIYRDARRRFWLATRGDGLVFWDPQRSFVRSFSTQTGLISDVIYTVLEDCNGLLWLPTNKGLIRFDPVKGESFFFRGEDGLASPEFNFLAHAKGPDGLFYLGGVGGITAFHPDSVAHFGRIDIPVSIIKFEEWSPNSGVMTDRTRDLLEEWRIILRPPVRSFHLSFAFLSYEKPQHFQYAYWLEGLEQSWTFLSEPSIYLTRIPPGRYVLHINGRGANGQWSQGELRIPVWVRTPFFLRPVFWVVALIVLAGAAFLIYRLNILRLKARQAWLEKEVDRRTQALKESREIIGQQYKELEKANQTKDHLFLILAHEMKNPVLSFRNVSQKINYLLRKKQTDRLLELSANLDRDALNAHNLLDNLLQWAKTQRGTFVLHYRVISMQEAFVSVIAQYRERILEKGINLTTSVKGEVTVWADPAALQILLRNLVDNAIKFTKKGGAIRLSAESLENEIIIKVEDTGIGMGPETIEALFQPKDRASVGTAGEKGTGLGLLLVRELMELHKGSIEVSSETNLGSSFVLLFPARGPEPEPEEKIE